MSVRRRAFQRWSMGFAKGRRPDVARQVRHLQRWAERFAGAFPELHEPVPGHEYVRWKLPCSLEIVEGRHALRSTRIAAAQSLIDAVGHLVAAKPAGAGAVRVTCAIYPDGLWDSEICIYLTEAYWQARTSEQDSPSGTYSHIRGRSLAAEWGLQLPPGVQELGLRSEPGPGGNPDDGNGPCECWYYGQVA